MKRILICFFFFMPVTWMKPGELPPDPVAYYQKYKKNFTDLENNIHFLQKESIHRGLIHSSATAMYSNGHRIYADLNGLQSTTVMPIASLSKPFTAFAILKLAEANQIDLYSPVTDYLPASPELFALKDKNVRIIDLLMQVSGIPYDSNHAKYTHINIQGRNYSIPLPVYPAGEKFIYSNANYRLLSVIIENVTGRKFQEYMKSEIFSSFGMEQSLYGENANAGAAGMASSMDDIARFANEWIHRREDGFRFISGDKLVSAFSPPPNMKEEKDMDYYGLGWRVKMRHNRLHSFYHTGIWHGTLAVLVVYPAKNAFFIHLATPPDIYTKSINDYRWQMDSLADKFAAKLPDVL